jgi:methyltransferase (TIGR00027 family)
MPELALKPVAKTAYYCCGARAADAESRRPVCGDNLARLFMNAEADSVFARFRDCTGANAQNAARHRIIDDALRERLRSASDLRVVLLGAGFDTRAFRLAGGRWVELDEPSIVAIKEAVLPANSAPNPLARVGVEFATESLSDKLAPWAGESPAVVVMEGVSLYLKLSELRSTLDILRRLLPRHVLICDLHRASCMRRYGGSLRRRFEALGARYGELVENPEAFVATAGYRLINRIRVFDRTCELGALWMPRILRATLLRGICEGSAICEFEAAA